MKGIRRAMLPGIAGLAVAAPLLVGGAGVASAAPVSPAVHTSSPVTLACNSHARLPWTLRGSNRVEAVYQHRTFTYTVTFRQVGSCLSGTLTDPYYPTTGPLSGTVTANHVTFTFRYPRGSVQGTRTYSGTINRRGAVSGRWSETGREHGSGTFTLAVNAHRA